MFKGVDAFLRIDGTGFECGEKGGGVWESRSFLRASDCQHTKDVLRYMGPLAFWGYGGVTRSIEPDFHPHPRLA